jgi:hypothetical protein
MTRHILTLCFAFFTAESITAQPKNAPQKAEEKKTKEVMIKELEEQKHQLHEQEKTALKTLDARYDYIIKNLDPKEIHRQLVEGAKLVHRVHEVIGIGDFDYGGHRHAAQKSLEAAEGHIHAMIAHDDTIEQRKKTAEGLLEAHTNVKKAVAFSVEKYGLGVGVGVKQANEPEPRAAANRQLVEELPKIELTYHLVAAVDHEIKDYQVEKKELSKKRDDAKHQVREQTSTQIKQIEGQIKALKK